MPSPASPARDAPPASFAPSWGSPPASPVPAEGAWLCFRALTQSFSPRLSQQDPKTQHVEAEFLVSFPPVPGAGHEQIFRPEPPRLCLQPGGGGRRGLRVMRNLGEEGNSGCLVPGSLPFLLGHDRRFSGRGGEGTPRLRG